MKGSTCDLLDFCKVLVILEGCDNGIWMKLAVHRIKKQA